MIKQGLNNDSILEKKFRILRTSIMLGNVRDRDEMLANYADTAKEIDRIKRSIYEEKVASKMYTTTSLIEEATRLNELIELIETRISERNAFIDDYIAVTNSYLDDLPRVSEEDSLVDYKVRLDNISEFLSNCNEINALNDKLKELRDELEEKYENKANNEIINDKLEDELIEEFNKFITSDSYYAGLNYTDIDEELVKIDNSLKEKYDVMNTFVSSYEALRNAGISGGEREEYLSYVKDSKLDYYNELEKKYILNIYKLVLDKENDYNKLYEKRERINNILSERSNARANLDINMRDNLSYFMDLCQEQFGVIKSQKFNIDNIDSLIVAISDCESKLESLEIANSRKEIVDLVAEYEEEAPNAIKIDIPNEEKIKEEFAEDNKVEFDNKEPNLVVKVSEPVKINVKLASSTAKLVMKKVVIVLEPKKFNNKRDKIKEAEEELKKEKELALEKEREKEKEKEKEEEVKDIYEGDSNFADLDVFNDTATAHDDVFINFNEGVDKEEVVENRDKPSYLQDLNFDLTNGSNTIPTEIFVEEAKDEEEPLDLFSSTDPFLNDNKEEIKDTDKPEKLINGVPVVDSIGTVKPNNVLSKIKQATEENKKINLPTMGLVDEKTEDVPIVSENYIKD